MEFKNTEKGAKWRRGDENQKNKNKNWDTSISQDTQIHQTSGVEGEECCLFLKTSKSKVIMKGWTSSDLTVYSDTLYFSVQWGKLSLNQRYLLALSKLCHLAEAHYPHLKIKRVIIFASLYRTEVSQTIRCMCKRFVTNQWMHKCTPLQSLLLQERKMTYRHEW